MSPLPHSREGGQVGRLDHLDGELDAALLREMWLHGWQKSLVSHAVLERFHQIHTSYAYPEVEQVEHRWRIEQAAARQKLDHHPWKTVECGSQQTEQRQEGHVAQQEGTEKDHSKRRGRSAGP